MFGRKAFTNALTAELSQSPPVGKVLSHHLLAETVSHDAPAFLDYLKANNFANLHTLIEFAFTDTHKGETDPQYKFFQVNRNASNILCSQSRGIRGVICEDGTAFDMMWNFFNDQKYKEWTTNPVFAGHYQRVFENLARANQEKLKSAIRDLKKLIQFLVDNIQCMAYSILLTTIMTDFNWLIDRKEVVSMILAGAAAMALRSDDINTHLRQAEMTQRTVNGKESATFASDAMRKKLEATQPVTFKGERLPVPMYFLTDASESNFRAMRVRGKCEFQDVKKSVQQKYSCKDAAPELSPDALELAQLKVYMLLLAIREASYYDDEVYKALQNETCVECLFVCGVFCDENSCAAVQAFRLLDTVINGTVRDEYAYRQLIQNGKHFDYEFDSPTLDIPKMRDAHSTDSGPEWLSQMTERFSKCIEFSRYVTSQIIAAFPLFWDRPVADSQKLPAADVTWELLEPTDDIPKGELTVTEIHETIHERSRTPLEMYSFALLGDPPMSDSLNQQIMAILRRYSCWARKRRNEHYQLLIDGKETWVDYQTECFKQYLTFFNFLRAPFSKALGPLQPDRDEEVMKRKAEEVNLSIAPSYIREEPPREGKEQPSFSGKARCAINGFIYDFVDFWVGKDDNEFNFVLDDLGNDLGMIEFEGKVTADDTLLMKGYFPIHDFLERAFHNYETGPSSEKPQNFPPNYEPDLGEKSARELD